MTDLSVCLSFEGWDSSQRSKTERWSGTVMQLRATLIGVVVFKSWREAHISVSLTESSVINDVGSF